MKGGYDKNGKWIGYPRPGEKDYDMHGEEVKKPYLFSEYANSPINNNNKDRGGTFDGILLFFILVLFRKKFSAKTFILSTIICGTICAISYFAVLNQLHGTLDPGSFLTAFADGFVVLRFPAFQLLGKNLLVKMILGGGSNLIYAAFLINGFFYGLLLERLLSNFRDH